MTIEAKIIADSVSPAGIRLCTMQLRYPRFIHSEFMTHRVFSRNASSSRAIPVERMIASLREDPAMPVSWGRNQRGMQAGSELTEQEVASCRSNWLNSMENAIHSANQLIELGLHKQIANRILEPWAHISVVATATDWSNFFALRIHPDAQPEIRELAGAMQRAMETSLSEPLWPGEWHLPYVDGHDGGQSLPLATDEEIEIAKKVSAARCARVSYLTHEGRETTVEEDLALYDRLVGSVPLHASPVEHQATPDVPIMGSSFSGSRDYVLKGWENQKEHGNFDGWRQYRKMLETKFI